MKKIIFLMNLKLYICVSTIESGKLYVNFRMICTGRKIYLVLWKWKRDLSLERKKTSFQKKKDLFHVWALGMDWPHSPVGGQGCLHIPMWTPWKDVSELFSSQPLFDCFVFQISKKKLFFPAPISLGCPLFAPAECMIKYFMLDT